MVVENPCERPRAYAIQGGFDSRISSFNRATQAQRQPGSTIKPFVYADRARQRHDADLDHRRRPLLRLAERLTGPEMLPQFRWRRRRGRTDDALGPRTIAQPDDGARRMPTPAWTMSPTPSARWVIGDYPDYLSYALGAGETTVLKMTNAFCNVWSIMAASSNRR